MLYPWLMPYYQQFATSLLQNRLASSMIISGHEGLGGRELALEMAKLYLCLNPNENGPCGHCRSCLAMARLTHPDLKVAYTSTADEADNDLDFTQDLSALLVREEVSTRRSMRVDTMRKITDFLNESAAGGGRGKVVIIDGAHLMGESAANAILKTFEEPSPNSLIIILTKSLESLLPTILSRATKVVLKDVPVAEATAFLLDPANQKPVVLHRVDDDEATIAEADREALEKCPGLQEPITQKRAEIALALNSYAPLAAKQMLLAGDDSKALDVVEKIVAAINSSGVAVQSYQKNNIQYEAMINDVITALKALSKPRQSQLLSELILEVLKYKAYVDESKLPLIQYAQAQVLQHLQVDHLFEAMDKLRYIEDRSPLIPSRAPVALIRAWIKALNPIPSNR